MTNQVTYAIELTPENAPKIDAINRIILGSAYSTMETKVAATEIEKAATKASAQAAKTTTKADKPATKEKAEPKAEESTGVTLDDVKSAAKKAKADHGEEFAMEVLKTAGVAVAATLGRSMAKIDADMYDAIIAAWVEGPKATEQASDEPEDDLDEDDGFGDDEEDTSEVTADAVKTALKASDEPEDDLDEDDGFGDDEEDTSEVTADAVKTALKAYAKEVGRDEAKEIMQKHGAAALSKVDDCTPKQLSAMFSELV